MDYDIDKNVYNRKKELLNSNEQKNQKLYYPHISPDKNGPKKKMFISIN